MNVYRAAATVRTIRLIKAQALREAAEGWGDGHEGFPHNWLHDRADELENGREPNWSAES